jgi:hypothetical protein
MTQERRLDCILDFFNKRYDGTLFFPDVYYRFKFCAYVAAGAERKFKQISFGFFIRDLTEIRNPDRVFNVAPDDIVRINPNSGTAPIFQSRRDLELTKRIYECFPVLMNRMTDSPRNVWPIRYVRMFDMANDSGLFLNPEGLKKQGAYPVGKNTWKKGDREFLPLYEGKMVQAYDHRASDILLADGNLFRTGQGRELTLAEHNDPARAPVPRYWVESSKIDWAPPTNWCLAIKDVTSVTNARTMIATMIPRVGAGHTLPVIFPEPPAQNETSKLPSYADDAVVLVANMNCVILDYLARQKVHNNHLAWYLVEQLPFLDAAAYDRRFGKKTARVIAREHVLALTYTAHDMAPFAVDMGHVDKTGKALPPFPWDETERAHARAKLDALFFQLYGVTEESDVTHIFSTFPIVEREDKDRWGRYLSRDLALAYINALAAGDPDAKVAL